MKYVIGSYGHMNSRLKEVKTISAPVDVLFLGSSHAYRGFDGRNLQGINTFNLGSSSQTPLQTNVLLHRYWNQLKPAKVLYEVFPFSFTQDGVESSLDILANDRNDWRSVKMSLTQNNIEVYNSLFFSTANQWLGRDADFAEARKKREDTYIDGGFVEREAAYYDNKKLPQVTWKPRENQMCYFEKNLKFMKENGAEVILVFAPITHERYSTFRNLDYFDSVMRGYGTYIDFNKEVSLNDSLHFYDSHHLNQDGVNIFNAKLLEYLKKPNNEN